MPSALAESGAYQSDRALPVSPRHCPLPLACYHLPKDTKLELGRGTRLGSTILNQSNCCRISTDRLNRDDSQMAAFLKGEPGPTPAGKTLQHSYPETRFRGYTLTVLIRQPFYTLFTASWLSFEALYLVHELSFTVGI